MHIVDILKGHLNDMVVEDYIADYEYTYAEQFNVIAGRCKTPVGVLLIPNKWKLDFNQSHAREHGEFHVYFLTTQPQLDFDATDNETLIDEMIECSVDFVSRVLYDKRLHVEDIDVQMQSIYDANNKNLTGTHVILNLLEQQGRCITHRPTCDTI